MKTSFFIPTLIALGILMIAAAFLAIDQDVPAPPPAATEKSPAPTHAQTASPLGTTGNIAQQLERGFYTVEDLPAGSLIARQQAQGSTSVLVKVRKDLPPVEVTAVYEEDPDTGEREKIDEQMVYANLVSVRLRYGSDPTALYAAAERLGAKLHSAPVNPDEEYVLSWPDVRIGGFAEAKVALEQADEAVIRVLPVWVDDPAIRDQANRIAGLTEKL